MIDLVMLKDFLVLCRIKSFSRAAQECHVSVSGLSRRIQTLEQWLGAPVFERHKHALELTEAGRQLQGVAQDAVRALDNLRQSIRERDEDAQRRIRFCAPHILSSVFFPHWIPRLQADFRSAKFSVDCDYLPQCLSRLRDGSVDYVVALLDEGEAVSRRLGIDSEAEFQRLELGHEQLVAVCAPDAAGQPLFNLDRLQTEALSFLGYSEECHLGWALEPLLRDSGLFLQRHHSSSQTEGLRFFAQSRLGVAWLPHTLVREDLASRRLVRAGGQRFDVPLRYTLIRRRLPLPGEAERLWTVLPLGACQPGRGAGALRRRAAAVRAGRRQPIGAALRRGPGDPMAGRRAWRVRHPRGARRALRLPGRSPGAILVETHARGGEPMSDVRSVVVAGSRFGQFYAAGVAADPRFVLRGILGQGSRRSRALAERLGVETWCEVEALPDDVRLACVAVGGAARGEQGPALAEALMARGIDVLIEHPLLPREWQDLLRSAERLGRRCLLNTFYPQLPAVARFIELGRQLHRRRGIRHLDAACGVQVGFATLDILAALLEGVGPWSLESPSNDLSAMRGLSLVLAEVPLSLLVLNELAAADDGRMTLLQRVSLTTDRGTLSLLSPHGPLLWTPAVAVPAEDDDGLFALFDEIAGEPLPSAQLWYAEPCNWAQVHQLLWPAAAAEALALLADGDEVRRRNQRSLEVAALWQRIGECLGFPEAPPASLAPASLEQVLEQAS